MFNFYTVDDFSPPQVTKKEAGSYRAVVSDGRGEDVSTLDLLDEGDTWFSSQTNITAFCVIWFIMEISHLK